MLETIVLGPEFMQSRGLLDISNITRTPNTVGSSVVNPIINSIAEDDVRHYYAAENKAIFATFRTVMEDHKGRNFLQNYPTIRWLLHFFDPDQFNYLNPQVSMSDFFTQ